ncbi:MAG: 3-isopropylmalate dehydrogenase [Bacteroidia bacterium]
MVKKTIAVLEGDGIGPEVTREAIKVLNAVSQRFNHEFRFIYGLIGGAALEKQGIPLPPETIALCRTADSVLFGAVGDARYDQLPDASKRPEQGLLELRKKLGLFANLRPIRSYPALYDRSPLKNDRLKGVDFIFFRELSSGIYFGEKSLTKDSASDICLYTRAEIKRITIMALEAARNRNRQLCLIDKANVLATSRLWRDVLQEQAVRFPEVKLQYLYVDHAAMQLILNPAQFDVILTDNLFGDILSDEASVLAGSLGLLPSASIGKGVSLFEPIHGSYPQAAGKNIANPVGAILSAGMMLEYAFGLTVEAALVTNAVNETLSAGILTPDLDPVHGISTSAAGDVIARIVMEETMHHV